VAPGTLVRSLQTSSAPERAGIVHPAVNGLLGAPLRQLLPTASRGAGRYLLAYRVVVDGDPGDLTMPDSMRP